jgi:hypothetical protein
MPLNSASNLRLILLNARSLVERRDGLQKLASFERSIYLSDQRMRQRIVNTSTGGLEL